MLHNYVVDSDHHFIPYIPSRYPTITPLTSPQLKSNRSGQASSVLGGVRARHNDLQRIEKTLIDLAEIFQDMAQTVEAQDPATDLVEQNAISTVDNIDEGSKQIKLSSRIARATRRKKWWCFWIVVLIIIAIALAVGLGVGLTKAASKTV